MKHLLILIHRDHMSLHHMSCCCHRSLHTLTAAEAVQAELVDVLESQTRVRSPVVRHRHLMRMRLLLTCLLKIRSMRR